MMIWQEHYIFFFSFCSSNYSIWEIFILILTRARKVERKKERVFEDRFEKLLKQLERGGGGEGRETKSCGRARTVWIMSVQQGSTLGPHGTLLALAIMRGANRAWPKHESITLDYSTCQAMNWDNTATLRTRIQAWKTWNDPIEGRCVPLDASRFEFTRKFFFSPFDCSRFSFRKQLGLDRATTVNFISIYLVFCNLP